MSFQDNEPALAAGSLTALVAAAIAVAVAFGAPITAQQREAILSLVAVVAPIAVALLVRPHVVPVAHIMEAVAEENVQQRETERVRSSG
jgi:hypothetical protein